MTQEELSKTLKSEAISLGLCQQWQNSWSGRNNQELANMWLSGIDFAIKHNYPSIDFIKEHFDNDFLHENNIYVDEKVSVRNTGTPLVINGKCEGLVMFDGFHTATIYVRHDSHITLNVSGLANVWVHAYDNAVVDIIQNGASSVYAYPHGEKSTINAEGYVKIRKRDV